VGAQKKIKVFTFDLVEKKKESIEQAHAARLRFRGDELVAASWDGEHAGVSIWNLESGEHRHLDEHHAQTFGLDLDPTTGNVCAGGRPGVVARWSEDGEVIPFESLFHTKDIESIRFCGDEVVTASADRTAIRWTKDGQAIASYLSPEGRLCDAIVVHDEDRIYVTGPDFTGCYSLDGELQWSATPARSEFLTLTEEAVVVASYNTLLWLDRNDGAVLFQSEPFASSFIFRWARLDERRLAVAGYDDHALFVWDLQARELADTWSLPSSEKGGVCDMAQSEGRLFLSRWDKTVVVLDAASGAVVKRAALAGTRYPLGATADGTRLLATEGHVEIYDSESFDVVGTITVPSKLEIIATSPDGTYFFGAESGEIFTI